MLKTIPEIIIKIFIMPNYKHGQSKSKVNLNIRLKLSELKIDINEVHLGRRGIQLNNNGSAIPNVL